MKRVTTLGTVITAILIVMAFIGTAFGQIKLTPAQIAALQSKEQADIEMIMPPANSPVAAKRLRASRASLAGALPTGNPVQPQEDQPQTPPEYVVIDLGVSNGSASYATSINNHGQITGYLNYGTYTWAFEYQNGSMTEFANQLLHDDVSQGMSINDSAQVAGWLLYQPTRIGTPKFTEYPLLYQNGVVQYLGNFPGAPIGGTANWINNNGQIVGVSATTNGVDGHAFLFQNGVMEDIGSLSGYPDSVANSINSTGQIAGYASNGSTNHAFLYSGGIMQDIGSLGGTDCRANSINDSDQILGYSSLSNNLSGHAFLYQNSSIQDLGTLGGTNSGGSDINDNGQAVGDSQMPDGSTHAFLYQNGTMFDINAMLVITNYGWTIQAATGINNNGQIVGYGTNPSGQTHAVLLNPLPPGSVTAASIVQTNPPTYPTAPAKGEPDNGLIVITHGLLDPFDALDPAASTAWVENMSNSVAQYLTANRRAGWRVVGIHWDYAAGPTPGAALNNAAQIGRMLGDDIVAKGWTNVHFIAHSAGSELIETAAERMLDTSPTPVNIQCTFLDPYVGVLHEEANSYGEASLWSDCYLADDWTGNWTGTPLYFAYNADVTDLDPSAVEVPGYVSASDLTSPCYQSGASSHGWPIAFYQNSIDLNSSVFEWSMYDGFGFPLSMEANGWPAGPISYPPGNGVSYGTVTNLGPADSFCVAAPVADAIKVADAVFDAASTWASGTVATAARSAGLTADAPAWVSTVITPTNNVNDVSFDAEFTSGAGARGLLTVYWDSNLVGQVDEAAVNPGTNHYDLPVPLSSKGTSHVLGLHLDAFTDVASTIAITNIEADAAGVTEQPVLSVTTNAVNGSLVYQLSGQPDSYYIQASTDLSSTNWVNIALVKNTTNTAEFTDPASTNYPMRFYRAVAQ